MLRHMCSWPRGARGTHLQRRLGICWLDLGWAPNHALDSSLARGQPRTPRWPWQVSGQCPVHRPGSTAPPVTGASEQGSCSSSPRGRHAGGSCSVPSTALSAQGKRGDRGVCMTMHSSNPIQRLKSRTQQTLSQWDDPEMAVSYWKHCSPLRS